MVAFLVLKSIGSCIFNRNNYYLLQIDVSKEITMSLKSLLAEVWFSVKRVSGTCICTKECDCENPPPDNWDGESGAYGISNECTIHNDKPDPHPGCISFRHQ